MPDRAASRLLHLEPATGAIHHRSFRDVVDILESGDVLILNNTRVNSWRLIGQKSTGGVVEALVLKDLGGGDYECLLKPAKRLKPGTVFMVGEGLMGTVQPGGDEAIRIVHFTTTGPDLAQALSNAGHMPLPPYITETLDDPERYQTVFSHTPGSAAAPTAGLHFTEEILQELGKKGIQIGYVTLHVGIDTFRPIQVDDVSHHKMHGEMCEINPETAVLINKAKGRVIAVGTTAVRTLESFADGLGKVTSGVMESRMFITPGYQFQVVDGMFTNFHFPKTTMLLMISALATQERILEAYRSAIEHRYRFLSFGDSMLLLNSK